ncbi:hypothetical protein P3W45_001197 [Vairimorpha bombi]|jgi:exopolyphosphatase
MTLLKEKLETFLIRNKQKITHAQITICMGNEACDLDSFISSLVVSYAENIIHVVPMRKEVFLTKGDLVYVCDKFKIDVDNLIFLERPLGLFSENARKIGTHFLVNNEMYSLQDKEIKLVLTDHNQPMDELSDCEIEMIIDHHFLSNSISNAKRIYIDIDVGSATTLVSKYLGRDLSKKIHCFSRKTVLKKERDVTMLCAQLANLLLIPIIIDTKFLKKRTSAFDFFQYRKLKKISCLKKKELKKEYKAIKKARRNDHIFDTRLILQKDFKRYTLNDYSFGMSVIKYKFDKWIDRESSKISGLDANKLGMALYLQLQSFKEDMGLDFYFVSTKIKNVRTLIIIDFPFIKDLLNIDGIKKMEYKGLTYYKIEVKMTRKIFIPKVIEIMNLHINK